MSYERLFERNVAVGQSEISTDTLLFRFREEIYSVPTISTVGIATFNGEFYTAKVDKLRTLAGLVSTMIGASTNAIS